MSTNPDIGTSKHRKSIQVLALAPSDLIWVTLGQDTQSYCMISGQALVAMEAAAACVAITDAVEAARLDADGVAGAAAGAAAKDIPTYI